MLGDQLLAVWLRGSLVTGDFDPETSDIDLFCVVANPLTEAEFEALAIMHQRLSTLPNRYSHELELVYVPLAAVRRWQAGEQHPTLSRREELAYQEHGGNWLLERAMLLASGQNLYGPPPSELIDPVPDDEIREAIRLRLGDWREFALSPDDPAWQSGRSHAAYCLQTICRALYTLQTGKLGSKPQAVAWAVQVLPQPWRSLVACIPSWKSDRTFDPELNRRAQEFILWATQED